MSQDIKRTETPRFLQVIVRSFLVIGGAWVVFNLFSDFSMNVLKHIEDYYILGEQNVFTTQYIVNVVIEFIFRLSLAFMMIIAPIVGNGKVLNFFWVVTGGICGINAGYSVYKYLMFSVNLFRNYIFSFDGVLKILEFALFLSYIVSLSLICFYCGNLFSRRFRKVIVVFALFGMTYLFSALVISLFEEGDMAYLETIKNACNVVAFGSLYTFGILISRISPKTYTINGAGDDEKDNVESDIEIEDTTEILPDTEGVFEKVSLEEIGVLLIDEVDDEAPVANETEFVIEDDKQIINDMFENDDELLLDTDNEDDIPIENGFVIVSMDNENFDIDESLKEIQNSIIDFENNNSSLDDSK